MAIVNRFKDEDEVVRIANSTRYGLMAGVFTENITRALRLSSELDSGMVGINCVSMLCVQAPFGGTKELESVENVAWRLYGLSPKPRPSWSTCLTDSIKDNNTPKCGSKELGQLMASKMKAFG